LPATSILTFFPKLRLSAVASKLAVSDVFPSEEPLNSPIIILLLSLSGSAFAQAKPMGNCPFVGFRDGSDKQPNLAEVATSMPALTWMACDSPKGCVSLKVEPGSPVLVYKIEGQWTCGYGADRYGAGPAWFQSKDLRAVKFAIDPPIAAWNGIWKGGEDRVVISASKNSEELRLVGKAIWQGANGNEHLGDASGNAVPNGNRLHIVDGGCVIDLTLAGKYILADDNQGCGGMNVSFSGFWTRATIGRAATAKQ
jgi:hypothetical protein